MKSVLAFALLSASLASPLCATSWTHTTSADFSLGSGDGHVDVVASGDGAVRLAKLAGALGPFSNVGTHPTVSIWQGTGFSTGDALYTVGGVTGTGSTADYVVEVRRASVDGLGNLGAWATVSTLPAESNGPMVRWANRVYLAGGVTAQPPTYAHALTDTVRSATIDASGNLGAWQTMTSLPAAMAGHRLMAVKGRLYLLIPNSTAVWSAPIRGDGSLGAWVLQSATPRPTQPNAIFVASTGRGLWSFGRYINNTTATDEVWRSEALDDGSLSGSTSGWTSQTVLPATRFNDNAHPVMAGGHFYVCGGTTNSNTATNTVFSAAVPGAGALGSWTTEASTMTTALKDGVVLFAQGFLFYIGGYTGFSLDSATNIIQRASLNQGTSNAAEGSFAARFDLGSAQAVDRLEWTASPAANVSLQVRTADATGVFGNWTALTNSGTISIGATVQYVEYRAQLSDPGSGDAELQRVDLFDVAPTATASPSATPGATPIPWTHTTSADFSLGSGDGHVDVVASGDGAVRLAKLAGALGPFSNVGTHPTVSIWQGTGFSTGDALYTVGGVTGTGSTADYVVEVRRASVDGLGNLGAWATVSTLPAESNGPMVRWANRVYLAGGVTAQPPTYAHALTDTVRSATIDASGNLGAWQTMTSLPAAMAGHRLMAVKGRLYLLIPNSTAVWSAPIRGDGSLGAWVLQSATPRPTQPNAIFVASTGRGLWSFGRYINNTTATDEVWRSEALDDGSLSGSTSGWTSQTVLPATRFNDNAHPVMAGGHFYVCGGTTNSNTATNTVFSAAVPGAGALGSWTTEASTMTTALKDGVVLFAQGFLFYIGGYTGFSLDSATNIIQRASLNQGTSNAAEGSFAARFDLGSAQAVDRLEWTASPAANVSLQVRTADATGVFGNWTALTNSGTISIGATVQYVEYRAQLSDPGSGDAELQRVDLFPAGTPTASTTFSATPSATLTASATGTPTATPSTTPSATLTSSATGTPTATPTTTPSATRTASATATPTTTPSASPSATRTSSATNSVTATPSSTPSATLTASATNTASTTSSGTPSATRTNTTVVTATITPSITSSATFSSTATPAVATSTGTPTTTPVPSTATPQTTPTASTGDAGSVCPCPRWDPHNPDKPQRIVIKAEKGGNCWVKVMRPNGGLGKKVFEGELSANETKVLYWATDDDSGRKMASGIYIIMYKDGDGAVHRTKVAIIR